MTPQYGHVYLADLNPRFGTEPGKVRPVIVVQTDALNPYHFSTLICPLTTQVMDVPTPLRVSIPQGISGLTAISDILVDQIKGMLKKAASGVLAFLPCSRTESTLRSSIRLRPCWTDFFEHSLACWCRSSLRDLRAIEMRYSTGP